MQEKDNVLNILEGAIDALKREDVMTLRDLSNRTIHISSIYQDADNIMIAVVVYALAKLVERKNYRDYKGWGNFIKGYQESLERMISAIKVDNLEDFRKELGRLRESIEALSGKLKGYIRDVFLKAEVNRASRIYEHGISMRKTAEILGISIWELAEYAGQTGISDVDYSLTKDVRRRVEDAEEILS